MPASKEAANSFLNVELDYFYGDFAGRKDFVDGLVFNETDINGPNGQGKLSSCFTSEKKTAQGLLSLQLKDGKSFCVFGNSSVIHVTGSYSTIKNSITTTNAFYIMFHTGYMYNALKINGTQVTVTGNTFDKSGASFPFMFGYDARIDKAFAVANGVKFNSATQLGGNTFSSVLPLYLYQYDAGPSVHLWQLFSCSGEHAEYIADNAVSFESLLATMGNVRSRHSASTSKAIVLGDRYSYCFKQNNVYMCTCGTIVTPQITNLLSDSYVMSGWTLTNMSLASCFYKSSTGLYSLERIRETAVEDEHYCDIAFLPSATGRHWMHCELEFGHGIPYVGISVTNGTDAFYVALGSDGEQTDYFYSSTNPNAVIEQTGTNKYRVWMPLDLTVTDACTLRVRALRDVYEDYYLGLATNSLGVGNWAVVKAASRPKILPVSVGSPATAIASIVDWSESRVTNRLKNGRLTADVVVSMADWPQQNICLWSWRQDANNGVEVWLEFYGVSDSLVRYELTLRTFIGGVSADTSLSIGDAWSLGSTNGSHLVEKLRLNVAIDSSGLCKWWARSDEGDEIIGYELGCNTSGEDQISVYTPPVPTSLRLGSSLDGTGQAHMVIAEAAVW